MTEPVMRAAGLAAGVLLTATLSAAPQPEPPELDLLVERLGRYLAAYESAISAVIADEVYHQYEYLRNQRTSRKLESDMSFMRLPGGAEWFGVRHVRKVDGRQASEVDARLEQLLKDPGADVVERTRAIVIASALHNLGGTRTINMPTVALEMLSAVNHPRLIFTLRGKQRIGGVETWRLDFEEFDEPTLVRATDGSNAWTRGSVWVERANGRVWRTEIKVAPDSPQRFQRPELESRVRVDYAHDATLGLLVPTQLQESFWIRRGRGEGRARYSNFRRFTTSARIIP